MGSLALLLGLTCGAALPAIASTSITSSRAAFVGGVGHVHHLGGIARDVAVAGRFRQGKAESRRLSGKVATISMHTMGGNVPYPGGEEDEWLLPSHKKESGVEESSDVGSIWLGKDGEKEGEKVLMVSDVLLLWIWLERRLTKTVESEDFESAASIKKEMKVCHKSAMTILEAKIQAAANDMRAEKEKLRQDTLASIEMDFEAAIAEEDYSQAAKLQAEKKVEEQRRERMVGASPMRLLKKIDSYWLEGEINSKVSQMRQREAKLLEDPVARLKRDIEVAVENDDMAAAAQAAKQLRDEEHARELKVMEKALKRDCNYWMQEQDKKKQDSIAFLEQQLHDEVTAEDFESAQDTKRSLDAARFERSLADAVNRTREEALAMARLGPLWRLGEELRSAVEVEDFESAQRIRDEIEARDRAAALARELEEALHGQRFGEADKLRGQLVEAYAGKINPRVLRDLNYGGFSPPVFKIGDIVTTKQGYKGVIVGWHEWCMATEDWCERANVGGLAAGRAQRFYHILPDAKEAVVRSQGLAEKTGCEHVLQVESAFLFGFSKNDKSPKAVTTYVAEEELAKWDFEKPSPKVGFFQIMLRSVIPESPISNAMVSQLFFSYSRGRYLFGGSMRNVVLFHYPSDGQPLHEQQ